MDKFPCTNCGACCRSITNAEHLKDFDLGNGQCIYLEDNQCSIYKNRPLLCRIDEAYEKVFYQWYSKEEYYQLNAMACNELQVKAGLPESYRVIINNVG
jgi:uncharacterized protein